MDHFSWLNPSQMWQLLGGFKLDTKPKSRRAKHVLDRHRAFFVWRRALALSIEYPDWNFDQLKTRLHAEFEQIQALTLTTLGNRKRPARLLPGKSGIPDITPNHLDLRDIARVRTSDSSTDKRVRKRFGCFERLRRARGQAVVWRAAALAPTREIWATPVPGEKAKLKSRSVSLSGGATNSVTVGPIYEYLDRRLRVVERMHFNVATARSGSFCRHGAMGSRRWKVQGPKGPWKDGFRVRLFEYPRFPKWIEKKLGRSGVSKSNQAQLVGPEHDEPMHKEHAGNPHWKYTEDGRSIHWNVSPTKGGFAPWRLPRAIRSQWSAKSKDNYRINLQPAERVKAATIVDDLFDMSEDKQDLWHRAWLWCDHVIAACSIEALLHGLRRNVKDGEAVFDKLVYGENLPDGATEPYVSLGPVVGNREPLDKGRLMAHKNDRHFEQIKILSQDLQVGDHVVYWNSEIYRQLSLGDWGLENAYVIDIDSGDYPNGNPGGVNRRRVLLQGHGTKILSHRQYQRFLKNKVAMALRRARKEILENQDVKKAIASNSVLPLPDQIRTASGALLQRWEPFIETSSVRIGKRKLPLTAWWIVIPLNVTRWETIEEAVENTSRALGFDKNKKPIWANLHASIAPQSVPTLTGGDPNEPPYRQAIYFPIFEPKMSARHKGVELSGWSAFFHKKAAGEETFFGTLEVVRVDGSMIPGLFDAQGWTVVARPKASNI